MERLLENDFDKSAKALLDVEKNMLEVNWMASSRRKFVQGCLAAVGAAALGYLGSARHSHAWLGAPAAGPLDGGSGQSGGTREPGYLALERSGELERREQALKEMLKECRLCPRRCGVNRMAGEEGVCSVGDSFKVASHGPHFGEEPPLVGRRGSGTIFFSNCNLLCVFCQNWQINHRGDGQQTSHAELARMMLALQRAGCHNINLVTPTHLAPHIVSALRLAAADGLRLPLVYNTSGYDSLELIRLLDGVVDIYLPDFKYQDEATAARFSNGAPGYPEHAAAAIREMHRQVGVIRQTDGIAHGGLLIRHLVLPENMAGTDGFVRWVASELGPETHVNIMGQFAPQFRAHEYPPLSRRPTREELAQAMRWAREAGLRNLY